MEESVRGSALCKHNHIHAVQEAKGGGRISEVSTLCKHNYIHTVGAAEGDGGISKVKTVQAPSHTYCGGGQRW
jgi:hypothetical protein